MHARRLAARGHRRVRRICSGCWERHPPSSVAALVGAQYYWAAHVHPVAVLGYIAVLEGNPPDLKQENRVAARSGVPLAAFRACSCDMPRSIPFTAVRLDQALDRLPLTDAHASLMGVSAFHTIHWPTRVLQDALAGPQVGRGDLPTSSTGRCRHRRCHQGPGLSRGRQPLPARGGLTCRPVGRAIIVGSWPGMTKTSETSSRVIK